MNLINFFIYILNENKDKTWFGTLTNMYKPTSLERIQFLANKTSTPRDIEL